MSLRDPDVALVMNQAADALEKALDKHNSMASPHEGWSVIWEELEELREHIRADTGRSGGARKEALQIAAMGMRYALDLCAQEEGESWWVRRPDETEDAWRARCRNAEFMAFDPDNPDVPLD